MQQKGAIYRIETVTYESGMPFAAIDLDALFGKFNGLGGNDG